MPITHYQRPGLRPLVSPPTPVPARGLYQASNGNCYAVLGIDVYSVSPSWQLAKLGSMENQLRTNPVSMIDNRTDLLLVDGSSFGYQIHLADNSFSTVVDPTGTFVGADKVDYIDTFVLFNIPGGNQWGSTHSNNLVFDPLYVVGKTDYPDDLMTLIVNRHELLLIGALKTEIWYDAGNPNFPFAELPGAFFEHGTVAKYSVASADISVFWLGQDLQGSGVVFRGRGYQCTRISNHALEFQIRKMAATVGIADAIGYTYQLDGHVFYTLQFPKGNQTWVFDDSLGAKPDEAWHQEAWTDSDGNLNRHRGNCFASLHGTNVVGDWENGTLYALDPTVYTDTVAGVAVPIVCIRTFPHIGTIEARTGQALRADGRMIQFHSFMADLECGNGPVGSQVLLRWSDDRGKTFTGESLQTAGDLGQYLTRPLWQGIGQARDRVFELEYAIPGATALNGAWIDGQVLAV